MMLREPWRREDHSLASIQTGDNQQVQEFLGAFVALEFAYLLSRLTAFAFVTWGVMRAAKGLHQRMLRNIIRVPLRYLTATEHKIPSLSHQDVHVVWDDLLESI